MGRGKCYFIHPYFYILFEGEPATSLGPTHKVQDVCLQINYWSTCNVLEQLRISHYIVISVYYELYCF